MEELKKYTQKTKKDLLILGIFGVVFGIAAIVFFTKHSWILFIAMLLGSIALFVGAFSSTSIENKYFKAIENSSNKDTIISDFEKAVSYADDNIRMGEYYIFKKKYPEFYPYKNITELHYFEHHDIETARIEPGIAIVMTSGKSLTLCDLYCDNPQMQAQEIFEKVLSINPDVLIKY